MDVKTICRMSQSATQERRAAPAVRLVRPVHRFCIAVLIALRPIMRRGIYCLRSRLPIPILPIRSHFASGMLFAPVSAFRLHLPVSPQASGLCLLLPTLWPGRGPPPPYKCAAPQRILKPSATVQITTSPSGKTSFRSAQSGSPSNARRQLQGTPQPAPRPLRWARRMIPSSSPVPSPARKG